MSVSYLEKLGVKIEGIGSSTAFLTVHGKAGNRHDSG
jgi:hypothetical protein